MLFIYLINIKLDMMNMMEIILSENFYCDLGKVEILID